VPGEDLRQKEVKKKKGERKGFNEGHLACRETNHMHEKKPYGGGKKPLKLMCLRKHYSSEARVQFSKQGNGEKIVSESKHGQKKLLSTRVRWTGDIQGKGGNSVRKGKKNKTKKHN